jgi:hypothetical protein
VTLLLTDESPSVAHCMTRLRASRCCCCCCCCCCRCRRCCHVVSGFLACSPTSGHPAPASIPSVRPGRSRFPSHTCSAASQHLGLRLCCGKPYSHSMVPGGLEVMSYTTRLTRGTRLQMRADTSRSSAFVNSYLQRPAHRCHVAAAHRGQLSMGMCICIKGQSSTSRGLQLRHRLRINAGLSWLGRRSPTSRPSCHLTTLPPAAPRRASASAGRPVANTRLSMSAQL